MDDSFLGADGPGSSGNDTIIFGDLDGINHNPNDTTASPAGAGSGSEGSSSGTHGSSLSVLPSGGKAAATATVTVAAAGEAGEARNTNNSTPGLQSSSPRVGPASTTPTASATKPGQERTGEAVLAAFRRLLWFWREYYTRGGRDRLSLEFSSHVKFWAWRQVVSLLCADDGSATALVPGPIPLPRSPYELAARPLRRLAPSEDDMHYLL
ncbi:unnamed protein product [Discosporangium mesarthrocarpum]